MSIYSITKIDNKGVIVHHSKFTGTMEDALQHMGWKNGRPDSQYHDNTMEQLSIYYDEYDIYVLVETDKGS